MNIILIGVIWGVVGFLSFIPTYIVMITETYHPWSIDDLANWRDITAFRILLAMLGTIGGGITLIVGFFLILIFAISNFFSKCIYRIQSSQK